MSDYIDRQAALDAIQAEREYMTRREEWLAEHILTHCGYRIIDDLPPADVEPVRHTSEWQFDPISADWVCMDCLEHSIEHTAYCGHCGARMDGEQDD